jgi:hypothetical protein
MEMRRLENRFANEFAPTGVLRRARRAAPQSLSSNFNLPVMFISPTRSTLVKTRVEAIHEHCRERETQP